MKKTSNHLKIIKIKDPSTKWDLLSDFSPQEDCFVVSDVKTKIAVEEELLKKYNFLPGLCVLRASELYQEIFLRFNLDWNLVSDFFVKEMFSKFCEKQAVSWIKNLKNPSRFFDFFNAFLPLLFHPEGHSLFKEWVEKKQKHKSNFFHSFLDLSQNFFEVLKSKKIIHESALKALLFNHLPSLNHLNFSKNRIFVDLAFSFDLCEKEVFQEISRHKEVIILSPELTLASELINLDAKKDSNVYQKIEKELNKDQIISFSNFSKTNKDDKNKIEKKFFKIENKSTPLEEIRKVISQIHDWRSRGIAYKDIAIFAPNIEDYWWILKTYLKTENIPFKKSIVSQLGSFPDISYFLSAISVHLSYFSFIDLEQFVFYKNCRESFSNFKSHYFCIPERSMSKKFLKKNKILSSYKEITGREFIDWSLSFWPQAGDSSRLNKVLSILQQYFPMEEKMETSSWLRILEHHLLSQVVENEEEEPAGISCLSFNAFSSVKSSHVIIMGLDEKSLRNFSNSILSESEKESLLTDLDFVFPVQNFEEKECSLLWFLQSFNLKEVCLSCSSYNFNGEAQMQSSLYLLSDSWAGASNKEIKSLPVWDQKRKQNSHKQNVFKILDQQGVSKKQIKNIQQALQIPQPVFFHIQKPQISSGSLRQYRECPFKYAGEKIFYVKEKEFVQQEISHMSKGSLVHELLYNFLKMYPDCSASEKQKQNMIEEIIEKELEKNYKLVYKQQRLLIAEDLKKILDIFIQKEKEQILKYPDLKPIELEKNFYVFWNQEKNCFERKKTNHLSQYEMKGRVDRIDRDQNQGTYVLRDYKRSSYNLTNTDTWANEGKEELQLIFYAQFLEKGLIEGLSAGSVQALFYSIYGQDFLSKGFIDEESRLFESMKGTFMTKGRITKKRSKLGQAIVNTNRSVQKIVQGIEKGEFAPRPIKKEICEQCSFQQWCRIDTLEVKNV